MRKLNKTLGNYTGQGEITQNEDKLHRIGGN